MSAQSIGCPECAWGKVAGCWRCGSRMSRDCFPGDLGLSSMTRPIPYMLPEDFAAERERIAEQNNYEAGARLDSLIAIWSAVGIVVVLALVAMGVL